MSVNPAPQDDSKLGPTLDGASMSSPSKISVIAYKRGGEHVRDLRLRKGITQTELATMLGTAQAAIAAIEHGQRGVRVQQVVKIARALGSTPNDILGENPTDER